MRVLIILCFFTFFLRTYSQQYERGKKNFILTAEYGSLISNSKVFESYNIINGNSLGIGFGRKISSFLPFSFRLQYNYQNVSLPTSSNNSINIPEHTISIPVQFDINLFSLKLEKSQNLECRRLFTGILFSLNPELSFINNDLNFHRRILTPLELGFSFRICKSGGHKSVMNKDIHLYIFTRFDIVKRLNTYNDDLPLFENLIGLRLQLTKFSVSSFTQWYK